MSTEKEAADEISGRLRGKLDQAIIREGAVVLSWQDCRDAIDRLSRASGAINALEQEKELYRARWLGCVTPEEATRLRRVVAENAEMIALFKEREAADRSEIASLRSRVEQLERALRPFAEYAVGFGPHAREDDWVIATRPSGTRSLRMGHVREALATMPSPTPETKT